MAYDGGKAVSTGALFVSGEAAWLDFATTLPEYRGRGAQAALLARRIVDAAELGCRYLVVETAEDTPQRGAPSHRNMLRFGFQEAYARPNYIHTFTS
jgi:GNAT superfamily N-acetyltransferase